MDAGQILGRGISFPPRLDRNGRLAWSEGEDNVRESIRIILMTELHERVRLAQFGGSLRLFLFEPNTVTTRHLIADRITKALAEWEPRIIVQNVEVEVDPGDPQAAIATITYKLIAMQIAARVSLGMTLAG